MTNKPLLTNQQLIDVVIRMRAMEEAIILVRKIIAEAAMTGFNIHDGDWAQRLFDTQQDTYKAISLPDPSKSVAYQFKTNQFYLKRNRHEK